MTTTTPMERLRGLRAVGELAAAYHRVPALLAELLDEAAPADRDALLGRAGRLLAGLDLDEVLHHHPATQMVTVAITGQSTVAGLVDPLTAELARHGLLLRPLIGDHGGWLHDLTDPRGQLLPERPDLSLCLLDAETVFAELPSPWRVEELAEAAERVLERLARLAAEHERLAPGLLVLNTLPLLRRHAGQLVDHASRARLGAVWREFNARLLRLTERHRSLVVLDLDPLTAATGPVEDARLACYAQVRYTAPVLAGYAREVGHLTRSLTGLTRKCLVLDLDNTLWDGVLGEDGPDGIAAADTLRGEAFGAFQRTVRQLASQGVLLAVSSKNDRGPVLETLRSHPDLLLREPDFAEVRADWLPKDGHLADIARQLGIGTDSLVFADDSPGERAQVRFGLPEVAVLPLDGEPALHGERLLADGWFDVLRLTEEDRARPEQYRLEGERHRLREDSGSHADFLHQLGVSVRIGPPEPHEYPRLVQLTQRTNQFNLTGLRLQPGDPAAVAEDAGRLLLAIRAADRFGSNGLVGALLGRHTPDGLLLENAWLSCRVLTRGIEQAVLAALLAESRAAGRPAVHARFTPTAKNHRAELFYPELGFTETARTEDGVLFRHDLECPPEPPPHVHVTLDLGWPTDAWAR
ncbi:FkbH-like protein [Kitasatospora gansuensis]|uniref:FkbH-like protein n=1 Tax=Kitasatospora gansuensis TaxID=258050 RepID=A0A7W7S8Y3_9ACTN|nr:HAD-IIIC family phosphatase [Kitasatospora gansuensis]MBB4946083.1 FkbH-like protein [Kitasatospora gansuensis]